MSLPTSDASLRLIQVPFDSNGDLNLPESLLVMGETILDENGFLYYMNAGHLTDGTGDLFYSNGSVLADFNGNLFGVGDGVTIGGSTLIDGGAILNLSTLNVVDIIGAGVLIIQGNSFSSLFDATGGNVALATNAGEATMADAPTNANSFGGYDLTSFLTNTGDASNCTVDGNLLSGLFDGTAHINAAGINTNSGSVAVGSGLILYFTGAIADGILYGSGFSTSLDWNNRLAKTADGSTDVINWASVSDFGVSVLAASGAIVTTSAATSGTVAFTNPTGNLDETIYLSSASTILSITIPLPTTTRSGQIFRMVSKSAVTTLVISGGSIVSGTNPSTLMAGGSVAFQAINTTGSCIRLY